jgi:hypothetical protein
MTDFDGDKLLRRDMSGAVKKAVGAWLIPLRIVWLTAIVCGCAAIVASCGYRFPGGGGPPKGLETIFIGLIENRTSEIGVEIDLTNQLKNEFSRKYGGQLAPEDRAQGILSGKITGVRSWTVARRGAQASLEKRVSVTIDLTLKNQAGEVLWFTRGMTDSEVYTVEQSDKALTESNKRKAIEVVCLRLGEDAYYRMTDDF